MSTEHSGLVDAALEISARRRETLGRLREAVERGDKEDAFKISKELVGVDDEQQAQRPGESVN